MDRRFSCAFFLAMLFACTQISGCGGSGTALLSVLTTSLPNGTVGVPYTATLLATGGTSPYTWSQVSGGNMPGGVTLGTSGAFVGTPTTAGTFGPYVFEATDSNSDTATSKSMSITISGSALSVTTTSLPSGTVGTNYSVTLAASGGTPPYTWSQTSGGALPPGLQPITSGGLITGTPTSPGSYGPYVFTATDSKNVTAASANLTLTITGVAVAVCTPLGNEAALTSANPYAFLLKGTDGSGKPIVIAGSFTPDGSGGIANAAVDYNGFTNGPEQMQVNLANSSYSFGSSAQGCLYLSFSGLVTTQVSERQAQTMPHAERAAVVHGRNISKPATAGTVVPSVQFSFYLSGFQNSVYNTGRIIESDNTTGTGTNASGFLHVQTPTAFSLSSLQSNFAFGADGWTPETSIPLRTAIAGTFTNTAGTLSAGYVDVNAGGTPSGELSGATGNLDNVAIDTTTGRGEGSIFVTTPTGPLTYDFVFYIVNGSDLILLSADLTDTTNSPFLSGRALASTSSFSAGALNGYYLLAALGLDVSGASPGNFAEIGTMNATSAGGIPTATLYSNDAGTYATTQYPNSSYTVETSTGRVSFMGLSAAPPVLYLTAPGTTDDDIVGFLVGTDTNVSSGVAVSQSTSSPNYVLADISGSYASSTAEDVDGLNGAFLGQFLFTGTDTYSITSQTTTGKLTSFPSLGTISINSDGSGSLDGGNFPFATNGTTLFAIPDSGDPLLYVLTDVTLPN